MLLVLPILALFVCGATATVTCSGDEFFEYKFTPLEVGPVNRAEEANSKKRCGEKHCDIMVTLMGAAKCKKGKYGTILKAKKDKNIVKTEDFTPQHHGYTRFHQWSMGDGDSKLSVEVCDEDSLFRGGNDKLMQFDLTNLRKGCHRHRHNDRHPQHPWQFYYEVCCRPTGTRIGTGSKKRRGGRRGSRDW